MVINRRTFIASAASLLALPSRAQSFPSKGLQLIVPFAAGGAADIIGRVVSERLTVQTDDNQVAFWPCARWTSRARRSARHQGASHG
jgi:tripartite-type tricarboxylate transporter receptor subunit TctC